MMDKNDNAQVVRVCKGAVAQISHRMGSVWWLTKQECGVDHCVRGALRYSWMFVYQEMRMLCIGDQIDELSIPNQDAGEILYHGVGFFGAFRRDL